jgi:NhaP-type Na+/H+ or K+/H+ antiporter
MKDAFFMTWGGLRGAVGLALAMVVNSSIDPIQVQ